MSKVEQGQRWVFYQDAQCMAADAGVERKILAYNKDVMCVEHRFAAGARGTLHSHPHTQLTYVAQGKFEFTIEGETHVVEQGDTLLKTDGVLHGCLCLEAGVLCDIFLPMREDFLASAEQ